jgi:AcrR family transcriptional regulator
VSAAPSPVADLRQRVLDASVALIKDEGLAALSMREVARRAGVSHQAPYHHFPDREAILAAIAEEGFVELVARMREARAKPGTPGDRLVTLGRAYLAFAIDRNAHFRVMFRPELVSLDRFPDAKCRADDAFQELVGVVDELLREGLGRRDDSMPAACFAWAMVHGLASLMLDGPLAKKVPDARERDALVQSVLAFAGRLVDATAGATNAKPPKRTAKKRAP